MKKASSSASISWLTGIDRKSGRPEPEVQVTVSLLAQRRTEEEKRYPSGHRYSRDCNNMAVKERVSWDFHPHLFVNKTNLDLLNKRKKVH